MTITHGAVGIFGSRANMQGPATDRCAVSNGEHLPSSLCGETFLAKSEAICYIFMMTDTPKTKSAPDEWPNTVRTREELDSALEAGLKNGVSPRTFEEIIENAKSRLKNG